MNWLDLKLGGRMLARYPGLTIVGGLAMAFAIWVGIVIFQVVTLFVYPTLPLPSGDRIVELRSWDVATNDREERLIRDFADWRGTLRSITDLGAWRDSTRNLIVADGDARPVHVAEMSASGFRIASAEPLMGRLLTSADEAAAAPPVAVIGYDVWRRHFGSDASVIGRLVQLGHEHVTVVGVMREGFEFPVSHDLWLPLGARLLNQAPRSGPAISVFGMLAPGATLQTAQAEMTTRGRRAAIEWADTHAHLEPRVSPYAAMHAAEAGTELGIMVSMYFFACMLIALVCGNVGLLLFARAATREKDLVVRTALGASRSRIVGQLFAEALVLGLVAAAVGLAAADIALRQWGMTFLETNLGRLPFWFDLSLSPATVFVALGLAVFGACIAGVMPALKITRGMGDRLKQATAGGGGLQFGGVWSVVIVVQVAVTVAFPALVYWEQFQLRRVMGFDPGFAAHEYLALTIDRDNPADLNANADAMTIERNARMSATLEELRSRVAAVPGVVGVTFAARLPATEHPSGLIELGDDAARGAATTAGTRVTPDDIAGGSTNAKPLFREATVATVDPSYFGVLQAPILAGRAFTVADTQSDAHVAIVDQGFVDQVMQTRNAIGEQVRFVNPNDPAGPGRWYEVVGVVKELGTGAPTQRGRAAGFYIPGAPQLFDQIHMLVHVRSGDPLALAPQLRHLVTAVDPALRVGELRRADDVSRGIVWVIGVWLRLTVVMSAVAIVLSLAGIYAVLSFTVSRRTREIGVRVALGASRLRVVVAIFRRPLLKVGLGILAGMSIIFTIATLMKQTEFPGSDAGLSLTAFAMMATYAVAMLAVCMLACIVPTRRALRVEPTVALRME